MDYYAAGLALWAIAATAAAWWFRKVAGYTSKECARQMMRADTLESAYAEKCAIAQRQQRLLESMATPGVTRAIQHAIGLAEDGSARLAQRLGTTRLTRGPMNETRGGVRDGEGEAG